MPEYLTQKEAFGKCKRGGRFINTEQIDKEGNLNSEDTTASPTSV